MSDIASRVRRIMTEHLGVPIPELIGSADLIDDLGADSLDTVELTMAFEEEFGIEISDAAMEEVKTVDDCIALIESKMAMRAG